MATQPARRSSHSAGEDPQAAVGAPPGAPPQTRKRTRKQRRKQVQHETDRSLHAAARARKTVNRGTEMAALEHGGHLGVAPRGRVRLSAWFPAIPLDLYDAFLDKKRHGEMTGALAQIRPRVGARFCTGDGRYWGRNIELLPGERIVQEWETEDWPTGAPPSRVTLAFAGQNGGTELSIEHEDLPAHAVERYAQEWRKHYLDPMELFFALR